MRKKFLALLLALVMLLSLVPVAAFAAEDGVTGGTANSNGMVLTKTAKLESDGTYTINLEAFATGTTTVTSTTVATPLDVVIIVDQSGSMEGMVDDLQSAVTSFVNTIKTDATTNSVNHRIALVGFASGNANADPSEASNNFQNTEIFIGSKQYNYAGSSGNSSTESAAASTVYSSAFQDVTTTAGQNNLTASIAAFTYGGATFPQYAFEMTNGIFNANSNIETKEDGTKITRKRVVVFFTDGEPKKSSTESFRTSEANATIAKAYTTKNTYGATVYTVGLYDIADSTNITTFMNRVSSNYPTAQSMSNTVTTYTAVTGTPSTSGTYYYKTSSGSYERAYYCSGYNIGIASEAAGWFTEEHGGLSHGGSRLENVQFYTATTTTVEPTKAADKYYMTTSDSSELGKIFETISQDAISSGTTVTLTETAVMRDIMTPGAFQLPAGYNAGSQITVKTQAVTTTDDSTYTDGAVTEYTYDSTTGNFVSGENTITVTANTETDTIDVTGFNYADNYVSTGHAGNKIIITIKGVEATEAAATGETVLTNAATSGIYDGENMVTPIVAFPTPDTIIPNKSYVIDYAKPFGIDASSDWGSTGVSHLATSMAKFSTSATELDLTNGKVSASGTTLTYTPQTMSWNGYDKFFSFGTQGENIYQWAKVNVIPANNVYYEDDFIAAGSATDTAADDVVGIEYGDNWSITTGTGSNTETANGTIHGWEDSLSNDTTFSDGTAHVSSTPGATASFTFTGTGVDIYSYTDINSGVVIASLYKDDQTVANKTLIVDNLAVSGAYYQIPTLSFGPTTSITVKNEDGTTSSEFMSYGTYTVKLTVTSGKAVERDEEGNVVVDEEGNLVYSSESTRSTYYLDGIRIYNPVQNIEKTDETVQDAYTEEDAQGNITSTELNAVFAEVRDLMAENTSADGDTGTVFIDLDGNGTVAKQGAYDATEYGTYGPKNEVYLAAGQSITFKVDGTSSNFYQIGLKAPDGNGTTAQISNGDANAEATIAHSTDLYYKVVPTSTGMITIKNTGSELLSVTKIKMTGADTTSGIALLSITEEEASNEIAAFSLRSVAAYDATPEEELPETPEEPTVPETPEEPTVPETPEEPTVPETPEEPTVPETPEEPTDPEIPEEPTDPETPEEPTDPETPEEPTDPEIPDIDIEIENPEPKPEEKPVQKPDHHENLKKLVNNLFNKIFGWFGR